KPKKIKGWLKEHRQEREFLWKTLVARTNWLKESAKFDKHAPVYRFAERVERYAALEELYRSLMRKRQVHSRRVNQNPEKRFTPYERQGINLASGINEGLCKAWFKFN